MKRKQILRLISFQLSGMSKIKKLLTFMKNRKSELGLVFGLALYMLIAIVFSIPCPIRFLTGVSCPGCGMTRAALSLLRLDFSAAFHYHPLVFVLLPVAVTLYILTAKKLPKARRVFLLCVAFLFIAVYLYRFIFVKPEVLVFDPQNGFILSILQRIFNL